MTAPGAARKRALKSGSFRRGLEALRDELSDGLVGAPANVVAQIAGRLQAVLVELHRLDAAERLQRPSPPKVDKPAPEVAKRDELERRRHQRQSAAARRRVTRGAGGKQRA